MVVLPMASHSFYVFLLLLFCFGVEGRNFLQNGSTSNAVSLKKVAPHYFMPSNGSLSDVRPLEEEEDRPWTQNWAVVSTGNGEFYGAKASLNVWPLTQVTAWQTSGALIWVISGDHGPTNNMNVISAGWHVYEKLYGDYDTHFFVEWTADGFQKTGCFNLNCKGFVVDKSTKFVPGSKVSPLSDYGRTQYVITIKISKDPKTGDWWLHSGLKGDNPIGYFPKRLFTSLANSASRIDLGGTIGYDAKEIGPAAMGSGLAPREGYRKAAYLKDIQLVSKEGNTANISPSSTIEDRPECYRIDSKTLYFGGSGHCDDQE